jgi:hypothetical protein
MKQPKGFIQTRKDYLVYKLHNFLFGLKQSPHTWYDRIDTYLIKIGCQQYTTDTNVYIKKIKNSLVIIALYVEIDCIIVSNDPHKLLPQIKKILKS